MKHLVFNRDKAVINEIKEGEANFPTFNTSGAFREGENVLEIEVANRCLPDCWGRWKY